MDMKEIVLERIDSTNSYCREHLGELPVPVMVRAVAQDAGRGQRGNSWEAAPGRNLTFSILCRPGGVAPAEQFAISEAVALGIVGFLREIGIEAKVKWPNDIYVGDKKICGILIEHFLLGSEIEHSILGIGINLNQREFLSDAPNPVSVCQLLGREISVEESAWRVGELIEIRLRMIESSVGRAQTHLSFMECLWRGDGGTYRFRDVGRDKIFKGVILDVEPGGMLVISSEEEGEGERKYAFKEVEFLM